LQQSDHTRSQAYKWHNTGHCDVTGNKCLLLVEKCSLLFQLTQKLKTISMWNIKSKV